MGENYSDNLVSVIIPTYNRANMLKRALESVCNQSYEKLEIIVIVDNCIDNTLNIIKEINDRRIRYIELAENVGGAEARNIGINEAKGGYISFLDDDDEWMEEKVVEQINVFRKYTNIAIVSTNYYLTYNDKKIYMSQKENIDLSDILYKNYCGSFSFCMTKRNFINDLRINPILKNFQDRDLWIKILFKTGMQAKTLQKPYVNYYAGHYDQLTMDKNATYKSLIIFLRYHWHIMSILQKYYNLSILLSYKNFLMKDNLISKLKLSLKTIIYYWKSGYNQNYYTYIGIIRYSLTVNMRLFTFINRFKKGEFK